MKRGRPRFFMKNKLKNKLSGLPRLSRLSGLPRWPGLSVDNRIKIVLASVTFLVYFLSLARGPEIWDAPEYVKEGLEFLQDFDLGHFNRTEYNRDPLYILLTLPLFFLSAASGVKIEFLLNLFSVIPSMIAVVFIYKTARIFLNRKNSLLAGLLYIFMPWIWFNSILLDVHSLILCLDSIWFYFLMSGLKEKSDRKLLYSTVFLMLSVLSGIISAPLALVQAYFVLLHERKSSWQKRFRLALKHLLILSAALPFLYFWTDKVFVQKSSYELSYSLSTFVFTFMLAAWNAIHALSLPLLITFMLAAFYVYKIRNSSKIMNALLISLILMLVFHTPFLVLPNYIPIVVYMPIFILVPLFTMILLSKIGHETALSSLLILFMAIMFLPVAANFHFFNHPHEVYAKWSNDVLPAGSVVVTGHEIPFYQAYADFSAYYSLEEALSAAGDNASVYVTSQYFKNENEVEFDQLKELALLNPVSGGYDTYSSLVYENKTLNESQLKVKAAFTGTDRIRWMEDTYECFYSVYGNLAVKLFTCYDFPRLEYKIYELK